MTRQLPFRAAALLAALAFAALAPAQSDGARPAAGQAATPAKTAPAATAQKPSIRVQPPAAGNPSPARPQSTEKPPVPAATAQKPPTPGPPPVQRPAPARPAAPPAQKPSTPAQKPAAEKPPATPDAQGQTGYTYRSEGRRDPFVSLWNPGTGVRQRTRVEGLAGVYTVDLVVKGILQSNGKFVAIVLGPDAKRQYILHTNDRLADGVVKAITADSVLILQEVSDPLSLAKQREVRKTLRAVEEVK